MKNLWPEAFEANNLPSTKELLEEQARLLPRLTNDMVRAEITQLDEMDMIATGLSDDFGFRFDIRGKFLKAYRFNLFSFSHDITLYPVKLKIDEKIGMEMGIKRDPLNGCTIKIKDTHELEQTLNKIFSTQRLKSVISSIMRLSA